jgi:hypothetical protein
MESVFLVIEYCMEYNVKDFTTLKDAEVDFSNTLDQVFQRWEEVSQKCDEGELDKENRRIIRARVGNALTSGKYVNVANVYSIQLIVIPSLLRHA